jgi:hypothetical protein
MVATLHTPRMEPLRKKKADKAKKTFEKNGGFSAKHIRLQEALTEKRLRK